jgi:hypothetical protein
MTTKTTKCSLCRGDGHNRRTCPTRTATPPDTPPAPVPPTPVAPDASTLPPPPFLLPVPAFVAPPPPVRAPSPPTYKARPSPLDFFFSLRPIGRWTTEYRLLRTLYSVTPQMFRLDVAPHYSGTDTDPHDTLVFTAPGEKPTIYHLYCVSGTNPRGQPVKKWTNLTVMGLDGRPTLLASFNGSGL